MLRWVLPIIVLLCASCLTTTDSPACPTIAAQELQLLSTFKSCQSDADCVFYPRTACGMAGECGAVIDVNGQAQLDSLIRAWVNNCPNENEHCSACSDRPAPGAHCLSGVCRCAGDGC